MIEQLIKAATCRIACGTESGTGWLIAKNLVITARHCILANIENGQPIELIFPDSDDISATAKIVAQSEDLDVSLLEFESTSVAEPLLLSLKLPREGETWQTFGYPQAKTTFGHRLVGTVAQVLSPPKLKIDLDLSIDADVALQVYGGMSGSSVICDGVAVGMIRLKVDGSVAAISLSQLEDFLAENGVALTSESMAPSEPLLAERLEFSKGFTEAVMAQSGNCLFLGGAHGYGKSTFCRYFRTDKKLINLGAYCLSDPESALGANYRAQPQVFLDWLTTAVASVLNRTPPRKGEKSYAEQISQTSEYLGAFSNYCEQIGQQGVFFIDGLNEVQGEVMLNELVGLLPATLPPHVAVVLTAPNFASVAGALAGRVRNKDVFELPPLPDYACYRFCIRALKPERRSSALVDRICEKAKGHPLYLRYLIEYANHQEADNDLDDFPVLSGPIEEYYHGIWIKLLSDGDAINMLALMARLRWGVLIADFAKALNPTEQAQFVSVMSRIRHLLADEDTTAIYHASFSAFVVEQTVAIDELMYCRIATFCLDEPNLRYCTLNRIFHLSRAGNNAVFKECNQVWFDNAVSLGVELDALIADVDIVVKLAAMKAPTAEFFRLTLLAQRISFRYDTLFAQSARLIAEALIMLGRPEEALLHVVRLKTLIVGPGDALEIGFLLHRHGYDEEALILLDRVQRHILESYDAPMQLIELLQLCSWHLQTHFQIRLASDGSGMKQFESVMRLAKNACDDLLKGNPLEIDRCMQSLGAESNAYFLSFRDEYPEISRLKEALGDDVDLSLMIPSLCISLIKFEAKVENYRLSKKRKALAKVFSDLEELIPNAEIDPPLANAVTDTLIKFGAPTNVVKLLGAYRGEQTMQPIRIKEKNGVDVNHRHLQECLCDWRVAAYLDTSFQAPSSSIIANTGWFESVEQLIGTLYCCDGTARRAMADTNEEARNACLHQLKTQVIAPLAFTLQQRADWADSYAIPETALPGVYRQLAELLSDCYPEELSDWLDGLVLNADGQWGMYSEGFRSSAYQVVEQLTRGNSGGELTQSLLNLLRVWRDHVLRGVENRHELVPEILRLIPFFVTLGAKEDAERLYQHLLSVSMGPSWYKEDQLGIMTEALSSIDVGNDIGHKTQHIAAYLERASGEMTFQRYVRSQKSILIGQISRHGKCGSALAFFRRQCCGSMAELWAEAEQGAVDKVGPLKGNRFPGGALDDQAAILEFVENSGFVSWELRWAMLEVFHCGDSRHIVEFAKAYARIANEVAAAPELIRRFEILTNAETSEDDRSSFTSAFKSELNPEFHAAFATLIDDVTSKEIANLTEVLSEDLTSDGSVGEDEDEKRDEAMFLPGTFGRQKALRDADKILEKAENELSLGNQIAAKALAVKVLETSQEGGWSIWGQLSAGGERAEEILILNEVDVAKVIRYYAPLIEKERYVTNWIVAEHLIRKVGPMLDEAESGRMLDAVIEHVRLVVGDAAVEIQQFDFLAEDTSGLSPDSEVFGFIVWLCDHPQWLRRDRAASMLLWLVEQNPRLFPEAVAKAFSMDEGYGPDILCGVLDCASSRDPLETWDKILSDFELSEIIQELRHVSRMVILERIATRAVKAGSSSAKSAIASINATFAGKSGSTGRLELPEWAVVMAPEWSHIMDLMDADAITAWGIELERQCSPLSLSDAQALETAVLDSFREGRRPLDRWESKLRHSLNLALWARVSNVGAEKVERALRCYNPSQPERNLQGINNPFTDQLLAAVESGDYSSVLGSNSTAMLSYQDMIVSASRDGLTHVEVLCVLQPELNHSRSFRPQLDQSFRSSELPVASPPRTPFETCLRLMPEVLFFGMFTPSLPLQFFKGTVGAKDDDFVRENWRYSRRNEIRVFGQPERCGCSLSVPRKSVKIPGGFKLAWLVWIDREIVAFVDEGNNHQF